MDQNGPRVRVRKMVRCPGHRQQQIHQRLQLRMAQVKDAVTKVKEAKRGNRADQAQHRRDPQHQAHIPGLGLFLVMNVVIGDRQNGSVVEHRYHHDHHRGHWIEIEDQDRQHHEQQHAQCFGDAVDCIAVHPLDRSCAPP